jgi:succinyl-CoA synthetase beta subunit
MARLHEHQGKALLKQFKIPVPQGGPARTPQEAKSIASEIEGPVVVKAQIWSTGRAALGGIVFAAKPEEAAGIAKNFLDSGISNFKMDTVLIEEKIDIKREYFASLIIDDQTKAPMIVFSSAGGTGIEQIAREHPDAVQTYPIDIRTGLQDFEARNIVRRSGIEGKLQLSIGSMLVRLYQCARDLDARSVEINPLVLTTEGKLIAADCRITIDDYAIYRQPDLGIEVAREFDRPPSELEKIAWNVEKNDYRGTFYFIQMEEKINQDEGLIGFHGAGGGGSMMSMDAVIALGYRIANFVDTSGNPPASKVYRAAKIILSQSGIDGYFASGSGVASQEQFHSARGLVKAFMEEPLRIPAVIRLGGNAEERAIEILERSQSYIPAPLEGYGKDDSPGFCAERLNALIDAGREETPDFARFVHDKASSKPYSFETVTGGTITFDHSLCMGCETKICVDTCVPKILKLEGDLPVLAITEEDAKKGRCSECLACEIECWFDGNRGGMIELPIPGLEAYRESLT